MSWCLPKAWLNSSLYYNFTSTFCLREVTQGYYLSTAIIALPCTCVFSVWTWLLAVERILNLFRVSLSCSYPAFKFPLLKSLINCCILFPTSLKRKILLAFSSHSISLNISSRRDDIAWSKKFWLGFYRFVISSLAVAALFLKGSRIILRCTSYGKGMDENGCLHTIQEMYLTQYFWRRYIRNR